MKSCTEISIKTEEVIIVVFFQDTTFYILLYKQIQLKSESQELTLILFML